MSRQFRSAYTVAQAVAGPSSRPTRAMAMVNPSHMSQRTAFNFLGMVPDFIASRAKARKEAKATAEKPKESDDSAEKSRSSTKRPRKEETDDASTTSETASDGDLFKGLADEFKEVKGSQKSRQGTVAPKGSKTAKASLRSAVTYSRYGRRPRVVRPFRTKQQRKPQRQLERKPPSMEPPELPLAPSRGNPGARNLRKPKPDPTTFVARSFKQKMSNRKLNLIARQLSKLPLEEAILQMQFSDKGASRWIHELLKTSAKEAVEKTKVPLERLVVAEAYVNKEKTGPKRLDIKGRGRHGVRRHRYSRLKVVISQGRTHEERSFSKFKRRLDKEARSAGQVREDGKLRRKITSGWAW